MSEAEKKLMSEIRCVKCNRLLLKSDFVRAEIKCPKCGYINSINKTEIHCDSCGVILAKSSLPFFMDFKGNCPCCGKLKILVKRFPINDIMSPGEKVNYGRQNLINK